MSHVTHTNESCHTYGCVMSQALAETGWNESGMSHVTHIMSHITHTNSPRHTNKGVTSHMRMSHVTHMNE